jgi:hypothetical protein
MNVATIFFPTPRHSVSLEKESEPVEFLKVFSMLVIVLEGEEVVMVELFERPTHLTSDIVPLPFVYDPRHNTYDMFFMDSAPSSYSFRSTDHPDFDLIFDDTTMLVGLRVCNATNRLPRITR